MSISHSYSDVQGLNQAQEHFAVLSKSHGMADIPVGSVEELRPLCSRTKPAVDNDMCVGEF